MFASWCCLYNWIICGGFKENVKEDLTPLEEFIKNEISWSLDGMSFFDDSFFKDDINYFSDVINSYKTLDYILKTKDD